MTADTALVTWDGLTSDPLAALCGVSRLVLLAETDSTQNVAHALAEQGAAAGTVVLADAQHAGRGRLGRSWVSTPGSGVWCTIVERPRDERVLDVLSLRVGLNAAEALDQFAGARVGVKWPNDLVLPPEARNLPFAKLGGILVEARWAGNSLSWIAIGVGVNVTPPTDVHGAAGLTRDVRRADVLVAIVRAVRAAAAATGPLSSDELRRFALRDSLSGRRIVSPAVGTVSGITATGSIIVQTVRGAEHIRAGTIQLAEGA